MSPIGRKQRFWHIKCKKPCLFCNCFPWTVSESINQTALEDIMCKRHDFKPRFCPRWSYMVSTRVNHKFGKREYNFHYCKCCCYARIFFPRQLGILHMPKFFHIHDCFCKYFVSHELNRVRPLPRPSPSLSSSSFATTGAWTKNGAEWHAPTEQIAERVFSSRKCI